MAELGPDDEAIIAAAFDAAFYRTRNPDIEEAGLDPLQHFLGAGWREGRDPTGDFSVRAYLDANEDIALAGLNPFLHWLTHGRDEGRPLKLELGFRHAILHRAVRLEDRIEIERGHDLPGGTAAKLRTALKPLGDRLFVTVSHDAYVDRVGGVQLCIQREAAAAGEAGWSRLHLYPAMPSLVTDFESVDPVVGLIVDGKKKGLFSAALVAQVLAGRPRPAQVRFAVHSFLGHSVQAVSGVLDAAGARTGFLWLHDQSSLCAGYTLLRNDIAFCGAPPIDSMACGVCIYGLRRRVQVAEHAAFLEQFDVTVLAPSQAQLDLWRHGAPYRAVQAQVHPHAALQPIGDAAPAAAGALKVAFLGFAADHKGWPVFDRLARDFAGDARYQFLHLGGGAPEAGPWTTHSISPDGTDGPTMIEAVRDLNIDVAMILSICPETFSFTAHEAVASGAAVVALADSSAVARLASDPALGRVAADEDDLRSLFESGGIRQLARAKRKPALYALAYSRVTADFLPGAQS
jgi:hypothetical protein